ncbi:MAG: hypothetical protein WAN20_24365 [Pseudonocardiaceae bacterium]
MGRHSKQQGNRTPQRRTIAAVELVDTTGTAHRVTVDAAANGLPRGTYATLCGTEVVPAALVTPEAGTAGCAHRSLRSGRGPADEQCRPARNR